MRKATLALLLGASVMLLVLAGCEAGPQSGPGAGEQEAPESSEEMTTPAEEENEGAEEKAPADENAAPEGETEENADTVTKEQNTAAETPALGEEAQNEEESAAAEGPAWKEDIPEDIDKADLETEEAKLSYFYGTQIGQQLNMLGYEFHEQLLIQGMKDMLHDNEPLLTTAGMEQAFTLVEQEQEKYVERQRKKREEEMAKRRAEAEAYLEKQKQKEGFQSTESGLVYKVLEEGDGSSPDQGDKVKVHYEGRLVDGTVFDSTYEAGEPAEFVVQTGRGGVIPAWVEALQMMKEGGKMELVAPPELAYGERGKPPTGTGEIAIPSHAVLIFELELIEDMGPAPEDEQPSGMSQEEMLQRLIQQQMQQQQGQGGGARRGPGGGGAPGGTRGGGPRQ